MDYYELKNRTIHGPGLSEAGYFTDSVTRAENLLPVFNLIYKTGIMEGVARSVEPTKMSKVVES